MFYPDLVRKVKSLIQDNKLEQGITELKNVDVLMLDDFGAENSTAFIRDEIDPFISYLNKNMGKDVMKECIEYLERIKKSI